MISQSSTKLIIIIDYRLEVKTRRGYNARGIFYHLTLRALLLRGQISNSRGLNFFESIFYPGGI